VELYPIEALNELARYCSQAILWPTIDANLTHCRGVAAYSHWCLPRPSKLHLHPAERHVVRRCIVSVHMVEDLSLDVNQ